jgi:hypothetical protein
MLVRVQHSMHVCNTARMTYPTLPEAITSLGIQRAHMRAKLAEIDAALRLVLRDEKNRGEYPDEVLAVAAGITRETLVRWRRNTPPATE